MWGARKTGKSTFLKNHYPESVYYDLLNSEVYLKFLKNPDFFRKEILLLDDSKLENPIIVDEIQRVPEMLNEVHWLIENTKASFILCGSSARTLRRKGVNLLGGRAWSFNLFPLTSDEIGNYNLLKVLQSGTIPSHYETTHPNRALKGYINEYLIQEVQAESLVRNLPAFAKFLDCVGFSNGEQVNYNNISREVGIDVKTVKEYFQILIDTLLGYYLTPYRKQVKREIISSMPKFYLFDIGVANYLAKKIF